MSREMVQTAAKLLAKAQSTTSDHEAIALVERSYGLLAQVINAYDQEHDNGAGGPADASVAVCTSVAAGPGPRRPRRPSREQTARRTGRSTPSPATAGAGDGGYSWRRGIDVRL